MLYLKVICCSTPPRTSISIIKQTAARIKRWKLCTECFCFLQTEPVRFLSKGKVNSRTKLTFETKAKWISATLATKNYDFLSWNVPQWSALHIAAKTILTEISRALDSVRHIQFPTFSRIFKNSTVSQSFPKRTRNYAFIEKTGEKERKRIHSIKSWLMKDLYTIHNEYVIQS